MIFNRYGDGPLLTRRDIPAITTDIVDPSSVFNPGAVEKGGKTYLLLRVQTRGRRTFSVPARGDGYKFKLAKSPVEYSGLENLVDPDTGTPLIIHHIYDARITPLEDRLVVVTAVDTDQGCRLAVWRAVGKPQAGFAGLNQLELIGINLNRDTRNGVLFPEKIDGRYLMLDRPNDRRSGGGPRSGRGIVLSASDDLVDWEDLGPLMTGRPHYWDELIGSGPPPVKTRHGWTGLSGNVDYMAAQEIAKDVMDRYVAGDADEVYLVYNEFKNMAQQTMRTIKLLPSEPIVEDGVEQISSADFIFEPHFAAESRVVSMDHISVENKPGLFFVELRYAVLQTCYALFNT